MTERTRARVQDEIMRHLLAIRDIGRDYGILRGDVGISMHVDNEYVSAFALDDDDEKIFDFHQFIATKEGE